MRERNSLLSVYEPVDLEGWMERWTFFTRGDENGQINNLMKKRNFLYKNGHYMS